MQDDWDTMFLLDACRYDLWKSIDTPWDTLEYRISPNSYTVGFLKDTFSHKVYNDTVYVTANPQAYIHLDSPFFQEINVWDWGWNNELGTVQPEIMAEVVHDAHIKYPNKRIFAHFMQPHFPFIGPLGQEMNQRGYKGTRDLAKGENEKEKSSTIWELLRENEISSGRAWEAYKENLEIVTTELRDLIRDISGKIVISSDHGNLMGERMFPIPIRGYGHPPNLLKTELVKVPWVEIETGHRRTIFGGDEKNRSKRIDADVYSKLADLGYKD